MRFPWTNSDGTETWLTVTLMDGHTFTGKAEGWSGKVLIGTEFVRINREDGESILYPMHRVKEARYFERKKGSDES